MLEFALHMDTEAVEVPQGTLVRLVAWGRTRADAERAAMRAVAPKERVWWNFAEVDITHGGACPIDPDTIDGHGLLAVERDVDWAYAVYKAEVAL